MKRKKKIGNMVLSIAVFSAVVVGASVTINKQLNKQPDGGLQQISILNETESDTVEDVLNETQEIKEVVVIPEVEEQYQALIDDICYSVVSVDVCKELQLSQYDEDVNVNSDGTAGNGYSFVVVELGMENKSGLEYEGGYNSLKLNIWGNDGMSESVDMYMVDDNYDKIGRKDYFFYNMVNASSQLRKLIYVVEDDKLNENLVLCVDPNGMAEIGRAHV